MYILISLIVIWDQRSLSSSSRSGTPRDIGRRAFYFQGAKEHWLLFRGAGEEAYNFGDLGMSAQK